MKVVIAHNRYVSTRPSGENTIVDLEIEQLTAAGVTVVPFLRSSDEIATMPATAKATLPLSPLYNRGSQRTLGRLLAAERPDLMHLHNPYPLLSPAVVRTAHRYGVPVVQTVHNYRQVCASGLYFRDGAVCRDCAGRTFGLPAVVHSCYRGSRPQSLIMATTLAAHRGTWHSVDRYIALTSAIAAHLGEYGIPADRISVKPNAVPDPGPTTQDGSGFLFAARLSEEKGLGLLLDAWRRHPDGALGPLRIAGDGPLRDLAEAAAAERADVTYLGQRDAAGVRAAIREAGCVVTTPTWHDVLPTIALEAMSCGRPVLATAMGGLPFLLGADGAGGDGTSAGTSTGTGTSTGAGASTGAGTSAGPGASAGAREAVTGAAGGWVVRPEPDAVAAGLAVAAAGAGAASHTARERYLGTFTPQVLIGKLIEIYASVTESTT